MNSAKLFLNKPVEIFTNVYIYPPTVNDVLDNSDFRVIRPLLTLTQEEIEDYYAEKKQKGEEIGTTIPTPFQYLMKCAFTDEEFLKIAKKAFLFFLKKDAFFLFEEKKIAFMDLNNLPAKIEDLDSIFFLTEENFFSFQNLIRAAIGDAPAIPPDPTEHPKVKAMKAKARYRDKIKEKKAKGASFKTSLAAICCMGLGINPLNVGELSYSAMQLLMRTYREKEKYDIDIRSLLAGADASKMKMNYWIRDLENK